MLKWKHFWNYHSISPNQLTISFLWFKFTWMWYTNFHEKHRQLRVGGSCLWSPTKTWAIREVAPVIALPGCSTTTHLAGKDFGNHGEMRDEIHADPSRRATSFESSVISGSFERFWESMSGWMVVEFHYPITPKLPCEYTRYSFCLGLRVIYYQPYLFSEPVICNWQDVWIGAPYSGSGCTAKFEGLKRNLRWNLLEISNQKSFHGWFQQILYITKGKLPFFIWSPQN